MSAGLRYTRSKGGVLDGTPYREMAKNVKNIIEEELSDAGAEGVLEARDFVSNAGTGKQWSSPFRDRDGTVRSGPSAGRIASGKMYRALDFRLIRGKGVGLDVGWPGIWEEYFGVQGGEGFSAPGYRRVNKHVQGMGLIAHLRTYMRDRVDEALDRVEKRVADGL